MSMTKIDVLRANCKNSSFTTKQAHILGISSRMLSHLVKNRQLERIGRGLYIFPDFDTETEFQFHQIALIAKSIKNSVICVVSALNYWGLTEEFEQEYWLAIPNHFPTPKSINNAKYIRPRDLETGVISRVIAEQEVRITTSERSICEAFKYLSEESALSSLCAYLEQDQGKVNVIHLLDTASKLKSTKLIKIIQSAATATAKGYPKLNRDTLRAVNTWNQRVREKKYGC